jgi:hypothetical protein
MSSPFPVSADAYSITNSNHPKAQFLFASLLADGRAGFVCFNLHFFVLLTKCQQMGNDRIWNF